MATLEKANALLGELRTASYKAALKDHDELKAFAREQVAARSTNDNLDTGALATASNVMSRCRQGFSEELQQWDLTFWAERLREAKYDISDEQLRPYFSLPNVLDGLFKVTACTAAAQHSLPHDETQNFAA